MAQLGGQATGVPPKVMFVGAFPPFDSKVVGGNITDCRALLSSSFPSHFQLVLFDSTQRSTTPSPLVQRAFRAVARIFRFVKVFEQSRPKAVLMFCSSGLSFIEKSFFAAYARLRGIPSLLSIRSGHFIDQCRKSNAFRSLARTLLKIPRVLLSQGDVARNYFVEVLKVAPRRCVVLDSWVASSELLAIGDARERRAQIPLRVLFLGVLERFKGVFELLDVAASLRQQPGAPAFAFRLGGGGSELNALRARISDRRIEDSVELLGVLQQPEKIAALAEADIFVLPSHTEGLPNAMIEAMATGLPVVVTAVGNIPDVIKSGENGILIPPRDTAALADALLTLAKSPDLRRRLGTAGQATARSRFGTERAVGVLSNALNDAITGRPSAYASAHEVP